MNKPIESTAQGPGRAERLPSRAARTGAAVPARAARQIDADAARGAEARSVRLGGVSALTDAAMGPSELPDTLRLISALEAAASHADHAERAAPGLARLLRGVIEDETAKLSRYLDLRNA